MNLISMLTEMQKSCEEQEYQHETTVENKWNSDVRSDENQSEETACSNNALIVFSSDETTVSGNSKTNMTYYVKI